MQTVLKDVVVASCALAYSAAILGLAALMVLGTPGTPPPAESAPSAAEIESAPRPVPAAGNPLPPSGHRAAARVGKIEIRDM